MEFKELIEKIRKDRGECRVFIRLLRDFNGSKGTFFGEMLELVCSKRRNEFFEVVIKHKEEYYEFLGDYDSDSGISWNDFLSYQQVKPGKKEITVWNPI